MIYAARDLCEGQAIAVPSDVQAYLGAAVVERIDRYAQTRTTPLFRSDDSGVTWKGLHKSLKSWNVLGLAIDPATPRTLYAATAVGIYKSLDGGGSWVMQNPDLYVSALSLDPRATSVLYAGTHLGVLKSVDAGAKWAPLRLAPDPNAPPPAAAAAAAGSALPASNLPKLPVARRSSSTSSPSSPSSTSSTAPGAPTTDPAMLRPLPVRAGARPTPPAQRRLSIGDE